VVDADGAPIPQIAGRDTSLDWPHRQADAHWRLLEAAAVDQGVLTAEDAAALRAATIYAAEPLLKTFPQSLLFGWWSNAADTGTLASAKGKDAKVTADVVAKLVSDLDRATPAPYSGVASLSRASRVLTSTVLATDVVRVPRMGSRLDPFGPLPGAATREDKAPLAMAGLGTIPPSPGDNPLLLVNGEIVGRSFLSLPLIRRYRGFADPELGHTLLLALGLLGIRLLRTTEPGLHLRSFSDLAPVSTSFEIYDQDGPHAWTLDPTTDELLDVVADLGREAGWEGEKVVTATPTYLKLAGIAAEHRADK
jgi:CRISPR-associated protein Csb1